MRSCCLGCAGVVLRFDEVSDLGAGQSDRCLGRWIQAVSGLSCLMVFHGADDVPDRRVDDPVRVCCDQ